MRCFVFLSFICVLSACATAPTYDSDAKASSARVISKTVVASREQKVDGTVYAVVPIGGVFIPIQGAGTRTAIALFEYAVIDAEKKVTTVRTEAPFFETGQCVKLLTANGPTYPRLAYGANCMGF